MQYTEFNVPDRAAGLELDPAQCHRIFDEVSKFICSIHKITFTARKPVNDGKRSRDDEEEDNNQEVKKPRKNFALFGGRTERLLELEQRNSNAALIFTSRCDDAADQQEVMYDLLTWEAICKVKGRPIEFINHKGPALRVDWVRSFCRSHDFHVPEDVRDNVHGSVYRFVYYFQLTISSCC